MKKVLIITYYWPPAGGPGVQRVLKFAKYLPQFGWQPIILTVENGEYPAIDETLAEDIPECCKIYKTNSIEPTFLYKKFTGMMPDEKIPVAILAEENKNWKRRIAKWIRLNIFIPDAKIGWIPFAVKRGREIIKKEKPDIIFSSSPPPTVHLIAMKLAKWSGIKWVADFRDPWTDIYHYDESKKTKLTQNIESKLEEKVLNSCNKIITVSEGFKGLFKPKIERSKIIEVITNGFDQDDIQIKINKDYSNKFIISYAGKINHQQNPQNLWKTLSVIARNNDNFKRDLEIRLMGNINERVIQAIKLAGMNDNLINMNYINHNKLFHILSKSSILLLLVPDTKKNQGIIPGKIFEYISLKKYILGIGPPEGDSAKILNYTHSGKMFAFKDTKKLKYEILKLYDDWTKNNFSINPTNIEQFTRKNITKKILKTFEITL